MADTLFAAQEVLLGGEANDVLAAAVEYAGGRLRDAKATQVQYRPGRSLAVLYDARIAWRGKPLRTEGLVAMASTDGPPAGSLPVEADGLSIGVWRLAHDPLLPGLRVALAKEPARRLLGQRGGPVVISLRTYRPTRRAVVRLRGDRERYVKVVRPGQVARLVDLHALFTAGGLPAPAVASSDDADGLLCLEALPGRSLVDAIAEGAPLPSPASLVDVLDRVASVPLPSAQARRSARDDAPAHARFLAAVMPEVAERVEGVVAGLGKDEGPFTTIHGDFYEAQVLVGDDGGVTGLLDLDRAGVGHRADDFATMLAHLGALAIHRPPIAARALAYRDELWRHFASLVDAEDLRQRVTAVGLGLATGPYRLRRPDWKAETLQYLDHTKEHP